MRRKLTEAKKETKQPKPTHAMINPEDLKDPSPFGDLMRERQAQRKMILDAASHGCPISGALLALEHEARQIPGGDFFLDTEQDYREEDEDDDIRPY